jgi:excisionase family DNA binding protein
MTPLVTKVEASKALRVSLPTIDKLVRNGVLVSVRIGRKVMFRESDMETAVERLRS